MATTRVAAALMPSGWRSLAELIDMAAALVERAVAEGAALLALPGGAGCLAAGHDLGIADTVPCGWDALAEAASEAPVAAERWLELGAALTQGLSELARRHRMHLVAAGIPLAVPDGVANGAVACSRDGQLFVTQQQVHPSPPLVRLGFQAGEGLSPTRLGECSLGLLAGDDVLFPEVARILCLQGATLLTHPGMAKAGSRNALMARLWREVQANQVFGLEAAYTGDGVYGAAVLGPCELTSDHSGILAFAGGADAAIAVAELDWERRSEVIADYPIYGSLNPALYERSMPGLYERPTM